MRYVVSRLLDYVTWLLDDLCEWGVYFFILSNFMSYEVIFFIVIIY